MKNISFFLKLISFFILIFIWIFTILNYKNLPEIIPVHYDFAGNPDGFGSRKSLFLLNSLMTAIFVFLLYVAKRPNFPRLNIPQNLKDNPIISELVVSVLMVLTICLLGVISYESLLNALGEVTGLSSATHYLLGLLFLFIIGMMIYSWKLSKNKSKEVQSN